MGGRERGRVVSGPVSAIEGGVGGAVEVSLEAKETGMLGAKLIIGVTKLYEEGEGGREWVGSGKDGGGAAEGEEGGKLGGGANGRAAAEGVMYSAGTPQPPRLLTAAQLRIARQGVGSKQNREGEVDRVQSRFHVWREPSPTLTTSLFMLALPLHTP